MSKSQDKRKIDQVVSIVAEMYGVTLSYVRLIRDGKRTNKEILETYNRITQETISIIQTAKQSIRKDN